MNKADRKEYKRKLDYIFKNAKRIDYDWFDKDGLIIFVNDLQVVKKKNMYYIGYFAMGRNGKIYLFTQERFGDIPDSWDQMNCNVTDYVSKTLRAEFKELPHDIHFDWLFDNVSTYTLQWKTNKIYDELSLLEFKSH